VLPLFLDEDSMDRDLVRGLRRNGLDIVTVAEADRRRLSDEEQLIFAADQRRALYTANVPDFARLHRHWLARDRHHAGLIMLVDQRTPLGAQIRALVRLTNTLDVPAMQDRVEFLSNWVEA
jgi:nucleoside-triphosphatase THEP1